jgi:DNA-binding NarL/FixJ family response regulator
MTSLPPVMATIEPDTAKLLGWLRAVRERCPDLKVIVLSVHDEVAVRREAMDAGADAFVLKRAIATDLLPAIALVRGTRNGEGV